MAVDYVTRAQAPPDYPRTWPTECLAEQPSPPVHLCRLSRLAPLVMPTVISDPVTSVTLRLDPQSEGLSFGNLKGLKLLGNICPMPEETPYVLCEVQGCGFLHMPILLPWSIPMGSDLGPGSWPSNDWRAYLMCPGCGQLLLCRAQDVRWKELSKLDESLHSGLQWMCLNTPCEIENCETWTRVYFLARRTASSAVIRDSLEHKAVGKMSCGHEFHIGEASQLSCHDTPIPPVPD
jgi:hypothetical protein